MYGQGLLCCCGGCLCRVGEASRVAYDTACKLRSWPAYLPRRPQMVYIDSAHSNEPTEQLALDLAECGHPPKGPRRHQPTVDGCKKTQNTISDRVDEHGRSPTRNFGPNFLPTVVRLIVCSAAAEVPVPVHAERQVSPPGLE